MSTNWKNKETISNTILKDLIHRDYFSSEALEKVNINYITSTMQFWKPHYRRLSLTSCDSILGKLMSTSFKTGGLILSSFNPQAKVSLGKILNALMCNFWNCKCVFAYGFSYRVQRGVITHHKCASMQSPKTATAHLWTSKTWKMGWDNEGNSTAHQKWNKSVKKNVNDQKIQYAKYIWRLQRPFLTLTFT